MNPAKVSHIIANQAITLRYALLNILTALKTALRCKRTLQLIVSLFRCWPEAVVETGLDAMVSTGLGSHQCDLLFETLHTEK